MRSNPGPFSSERTSSRDLIPRIYVGAPAPAVDVDHIAKFAIERTARAFVWTAPSKYDSSRTESHRGAGEWFISTFADLAILGAFDFPFRNPQ